jgi:hypothetical protein
MGKRIFMAQVISFGTAKKLKDVQLEEPEYRAKILSMDKFELLEEMIRFQEERSGVEELSVSMMVRGKHLFKALEESAETRELALLTRSYRRHLEYELAERLKQG